MAWTTVFVDRDGVILRNRDSYVRNLREVEFLPNAINALQVMADAGLTIFIITNQAGIGKGLVAWDAVDEIHAAIHQRSNGAIRAFLVCPHTADSGCTCRKPKPGLLERAATQYGVDLSTSIMIGDHSTDIQAATNVGTPGILVLSGRTDRWGDTGGARWVVADLAAAAALIVRAGR